VRDIIPPDHETPPRTAGALGPRPNGHGAGDMPAYLDALRELMRAAWAGAMRERAGAA
jgi:hypothetical protein